MKAKKRKAESGDDDKGDGASASEDNPARKKWRTLHVKSFEERLKQNAVPVLMEFVSACEASEGGSLAVVQEFFTGGGQPQMFLKLLQSASDNERETLMFPVFSVLKHLLTCYMKVGEPEQRVLEAASWQLLTSHMALVREALASTRNAETCKAVLTMLAAMVTINAKLAKLVLTHVNITPKLAGALAKQSSSSAKSSSTVRTCFIHFLMAFLITDDPVILEMLCNKKGVLGSIIPGLVRDPVGTVLLVLTTLHYKLVEDKHVAKSSRMAVFSTAALRGLLALYVWVGPQSKQRASKLVTAEVDDQSRQLVSQEVHSLLLVLCTSHRLGIVFQGRGAVSHGKHNRLVKTMLEELKEPWEDELQWELALKTLVACPDLVHGFVSRMHQFLEPRNSIRWHRAVSFYKQLVESLDPEACLHPGKDVQGVLLALTAPTPVLKVVGGESLLHARLSVRHQLASLLCAILHATERFLRSAEARQLPGTAHLRRSVTSHLLKHVPSGSVLAQAWRKALDEAKDGGSEDEEETDAFCPRSLQEHVSMLLDLLDVYGRCLPGVLSAQVLAPERLLADVHALSPDTGQVVRALVVLFALDPSAFSPDKGLFRMAVALLLHLQDGPDPGSAQRVLQALLQQTGLFQADSCEPLVWLYCCTGTPPKARPPVEHLLTSALGLVAANPRPFADALSTAAQSARQHSCSPCKEDLRRILEELLENSEDGSKNVSVSTAHFGATLSPLLPGVLHLAAESRDAEAGIVEFISRVVVHLLHGQVSAGIMWHLLEHRKHLVLPAVCKYVQGWSPESSAALLKKPFRSESIERKLSRCLLQPNEMSVEEIFGDVLSHALSKSETPFTGDISTLLVKDSFHALLLLKLSLFHVAQLIAIGVVTKQLCENYWQSVLCLLCIVRTVTAAETKEVGVTCEGRHVENHFKSFFMHPAVLSAFTPLSKKSRDGRGRLVVDLVVSMVRAVGRTVSRDVLAPLRQRFVSRVCAWLRRCHKAGEAECDEEELLPVLELFQFTPEELRELLEQVAAASTELLCRPDGTPRLSVVGLLLSQLLQKVSVQHSTADHEGSILLQNTVENVTRHLMSLQCKNLENLYELEEGFLKFMKMFPHHLEYIKKDFLKCLLKNPNRSASAVRICAFLVERKEAFVSAFARCVLKRKHTLESDGCVFPVLTSALSHGKDAVGMPLLERVFKHYRHVIYQAILAYSGIPAWVNSNIDTLVVLIESCMGTAAYRELCHQVADKGVIRSSGHRSLLHSLFLCASQGGEDGALVTWCNMLLAAAAGVCRGRGAAGRLHHLGRCLHHCLEVAGPNGLAGVREGAGWWEFARPALGVGLEYSPQLLVVVAELCDALYQDGSNHTELVELFSMLVSHHQFLHSLFRDTPAKRPLVQLWTVLARKAPRIMNASHVATLLGSYGASLSITDQLILKLLWRYESGGVSLQKCRPYLWGEAAVIQYSLRSRLAAPLWEQPSVTQVLNLFTSDMVASTIASFPLTRALDVESPPHASQPCVYDPAFFLPLLSHVLSPENPVQLSKVHQSGALALCITSLSSDHAAVRRAACTDIARFYFHLEGSRQHREKELWLQLVDGLRDGVAADTEVPQLPSLATVYLAHATRHISSPGSPLCLPLHNYVCLRPALDLHAVPDFLRLFHSSDIHHRDHRQFILEVLRSGIRREADFNLVHKAVVYKMLMTYYFSVLADENCKVLILQVLQSSVKVPGAAAMLVSSYGLLSWLHGAVAGLERDRPRRTIAALHLLCDLWASLHARPGPAAGPFLGLLLSLLPVLPARLQVRTLCTYLGALSEAAVLLPGTLAPHDFSALLHYCRGVLGSIEEFQHLLLYGGKFSGRVDWKPATTELARARLHLRSFILTCLKQTRPPD